MSIFKFNLGDETKDKITQFKGIIIGRTEWFNGCIRYVLQSQSLANGAPGPEAVVDEAQLVLLKAAKVAPPIPETPVEKPARTGGPRNDPASPGRALISRLRR